MTAQSFGKLSCWNFNIPQEISSITTNRMQPHVEIVEQPISMGARFRYKCEGRSAGCIRGINSTKERKTHPAIKVFGYQGAASVLVSCVTKDGPPFYPHPHNLVGKTCTNGVCYKSINNPDMICNFATLGIQCVTRKEVQESLAHREKLRVNPFGTGFHNLEPNKHNLNAVRLCFQVFLPNENGKFCIPLEPVISNPIFDNKTVSDLTIKKLSHCSALASGGQQIILLCEQVKKDDIQILFFEDPDNPDAWHDYGKFSPDHVHKKVAITFQTPPYKDLNILHEVNCFIQLQRCSDGAVGKPIPFAFLPLQKDPEGLALKRSKFEALRLNRILQPNNLPVNPIGVPRLMKQAVRSKASCQSNSMNNFQRSFTPENNYQMQPSSSVQRNISFIPNINVLNGNQPKCDSASAMLSNSHPYPSNMDVLNGAQQKCSSTAVTMLNTQPCNSHQNVDEILAIAKQQIGMNSSQGFCETPSDETLDKLSSLDIGLDIGIDPSNDSEVNLSGITLDSFSEPSGFNFSSSLIDTKNLPEKMQLL